MVYFVLAALVLAIASPLRSTSFRSLMIATAVTCAFTAGTLGLYVPVRFVLVAALLAIILSSRPRPAAAMLGIALAVASLGIHSLGTDPLLAESQVRVFCVFPLAILAGRSLDSADRRTLFNCILGWAVVTASLAILEAQLDQWLFDHTTVEETLTRGGEVRAIVAAEHPLTLGTLLVAGLVVSASLEKSVVLRLALSGLLLGGMVASNTRAPIGAAVLMMIVSVLARRESRTLVRGNALAVVSMVVALGAGVFLLASDASGEINSPDTATASAQYREVIYRAGADSLREQPLGYGLGGLPYGVYRVSSPDGVLDLARTVDSEYVLLAFEMGFLGIALAALIIWRAVARGGMTNLQNRVTVGVLIVGLVLALHAWIGMGSFLMLLIGTCRPDESATNKVDARRTRRVRMSSHRERNQSVSAGPRESDEEPN